MPDNFYQEDYEPVRRPSARPSMAWWGQEADNTDPVEPVVRSHHSWPEGAPAKVTEDEVRNVRPKVALAADHESQIAKEAEFGSNSPVNPLPESDGAHEVRTQSGTMSPASSDPLPAKTKGWFVRRGHLISYFGLFFFTLVLFTRPSDWYPNDLTLNLAYYTGLFTLAVFVVTQLLREGNLTARPRELYFVLALLLAGFLSIPFADQDRAYAFETFKENFLRAILMFIVLVNVVRTERRLRWLLLLALGVGLYLAISALSDYSKGNLGVEGYRVQGAIGAMFGNPNDLAAYLTDMVPVAIAFLCISRGLVRRIFYALGIAVLVGGVVVTFSRGGSLALIAIVLVLTWKLGKRHRALFMTLALAVCIGSLAAAPGAYRTRLLSIFDSSLEVAAGSAEARRHLLQESIKVALRHPVLGIGMGNFRVIYKLMTHNSYTQVAAEMGLFGFFAYLLFIITPLKRLREIERATYGDPAQRRYYFMAVGLQGMLVAYMVSSFFGARAYYYNIYYLVGYAVSFRMIYYTRIGIPFDAPGLPQARDAELKRVDSTHQAAA